VCESNRQHVCAGRATVELTIEKQDGSLAYVTNEGGGPQKEVRWRPQHDMFHTQPAEQSPCTCTLPQAHLINTGVAALGE
jgi:hypothetical protein